MDRVNADYMGMLATVINAMALQDALEQLGVEVRVQTAIEMKELAEPYIRRKAIRHLEKDVSHFWVWNGTVFYHRQCSSFACSRNGYRSYFVGENVDGVYDCDPNKNESAKMYQALTYMDVLDRGLKS